MIVDERGEGDGSWMGRMRVEVDVDEVEVERRGTLFCRPAHGDALSRAA